MAEEDEDENERNWPPNRSVLPHLKEVRDRLFRAVWSDHVAQHLHTLGTTPASGIAQAGIAPEIIVEALNRSIISDIYTATENASNVISLRSILTATRASAGKLDERKDLPFYVSAWSWHPFMPGWGTWSWPTRREEKPISSKVRHLFKVLDRANGIIAPFRHSAVGHHLGLMESEASLTYNNMRLALLATLRVAESLSMLLSGTHAPMTEWIQTIPIEAGFRVTWDQRPGSGPELITPRLGDLAPADLGLDLGEQPKKGVQRVE